MLLFEVRRFCPNVKSSYNLFEGSVFCNSNIYFLQTAIPKTESVLAETGSEMLCQSRYHVAMKIDQTREPEEAMNRNKIPFLQIESYEHPWDKSARDALEQVPGCSG
jgi:hypothetical protein